MVIKTKVIATIGPSSRSRSVLKKLISSGMNVARLNFSHGSRADHLDIYRTIRAAADRAGKALPVIGDLQGPRIRVGRIGGSGSLELKNGEQVVLVPEEGPGSAGRIGTTYKLLARDVKPGDRVLINDGLIRLGRYDLEIYDYDGSVQVVPFDTVNDEFLPEIGFGDTSDTISVADFLTASIFVNTFSAIGKLSPERFHCLPAQS